MSQYTLKDLKEGQIVKFNIVVGANNEHVYSLISGIYDNKASIIDLAAADETSKMKWSLDLSKYDGSVVVLDIIELGLQERLKKEHPEEFV